MARTKGKASPAKIRRPGELIAKEDDNYSAEEGNDAFETVEEGDSASYWLKHLANSRKYEENWHDRAKTVIARYRDERESEIASVSRTTRKTNILWANTDTLMSHLCVDLGTPDVRRQFTQAGKKTKISRQAAEVLEKALTVEDHAYDVTHEFEDAIEDHLLPGRGTIWLDLEEAEDEDGDLNWFAARILHLDWGRFLMGKAQKWNEVPWVSRAHLFSKADLRKSFPKYAKDIPLTYSVIDQGKARANEQGYQRALVYEIWCKETMQRVYVAEDFQKVLKADKDPYRLKDFFPCAKPLYALKTTDSMLPTPLFEMYRDQAEELDRITTRAYRIVETIKYCGIYASPDGNDSGMPDLRSLDDGQFLPMKGAATLMQEGGLAKFFMPRDLGPISQAYDAVMKQRASIVQTILEITGISDIMRGQGTDPRETATAQKLKTRFGSSRSSRRQKVVQRFVRDGYRLKAELIAEHYPREQLEAMTGLRMPTKEDQEKAKNGLAQAQQMMQEAKQRQAAIVQQQTPPAAPGQPGQPPQPPQPNPQAMAMANQMAPLPPFDQDSIAEMQETVQAIAWEDIKKVLRSNTRRLFNVDIETDDTAFEDEETKKAGAIEFFKVLTESMKETLPAIQQNPIILPLAKEAMLMLANSYKVGEPFEDVIGDIFDKLAKQPPAQPQQDPKAAAEAAKLKALNVTTQARLQNDAAEAKQAAEEHQATMQERMQNRAQDQQIHQAKMQALMEELSAKHEKTQLEIQEMKARLMAAGLPMQPLAAHTQPMAN